MEPRPPRRQQKFKAAPPVGPPPQHAYMLVRKGQAPGTDVNVIPPPPPPAMIPHPPVEDDRSSRTQPQGALEVAEYLRKLERERYEEIMRQREREAARGQRLKEPVPLPDLVLTASRWLLRLIVDGHIALCCYLILVYGYHLRPRAVVAIHGATLIGSVVLFGLLETVKCLVVAAVALVKDESRKRTAELEQRRERMLMKAQRVGTKDRDTGQQQGRDSGQATGVAKLAQKIQGNCLPMFQQKQKYQQRQGPQ